MRALLDTHCFLWFIAGDKRLSDTARRIMADLENELMLSVVSLWEIAIKTSLGKLDLSKPFDELIPEQLQANEIHTLAITLPHLSNMMALPFHHRDPFDRLIIAQGIAEHLPVITADQAFDKYAVTIIW